MRAEDIAMAELSMRAYALGLVAFMLIKVLAPGFYAQQDTKTPVKIGVIAMVSNMLLNVAFVFPLMWWFNIGHVGLALATSCSALLNAALLYRGLAARSLFAWQSGWGRLLRALGLGSGLMIVVLFTGVGLLPDFSEMSWWQRAQNLTLLVTSGALSFLLGAYLMGLRTADLRAPRAQESA
jgi:putative peptidoglycan lipid II flippase